MIGRIRGELIDKQPPFLLVDVNGVGYEIEAPASTLASCPAIGEQIILHTHLIVREDAQVLCGFISEQERQMFRHLIKVNGVGAKLALGILSGMSAESFARCVQEKDTAGLTQLSGVGKKTAERLIIEMRDRLKDMNINTFKLSDSDSVKSDRPDTHAMQDAISGLVSLGYKPQEASRLLQHVDLSGLNSEAIIKSALKVAATAG
ncbi:Holliday junction ATP-dependent DNA helicase RuvA [hydrothermal vent metagenome]|uniref:Holliday junction ATP-dependent DNA helicase RuvA n=1 Tax=hydrothermal vent metagenome TaxID=652676 RepID=A0A3B1ABW9_9ZZZZ